MVNTVLLNVEKKNALLNGKVDSWNTKLKQIMTVKEGSAQLSDSAVCDDQQNGYPVWCPRSMNKLNL